MANELQDTWDEIATKWNYWAPPLRPSYEDITTMKSALADWSKDKTFSEQLPAKAYLLGVTPEIANIEFPVPTSLLAVDKSAKMIELVWPGDNDQRKAVQGDWLKCTLTHNTQDIILADGSLVFFSPSKIFELMINHKRVLKKDGIFIARCFTKSNETESINGITEKVKDGLLTNFHEFKFRIAMALQATFTAGVKQNDVWVAIQQVLTDVPNHTFSAHDLETGDLYKDKEAKLYFPTIPELTKIMERSFNSVQVVEHSYKFGECCPTFVVQSKK